MLRYLGTITIPGAAFIRNNTTTGCSRLDLGTLGGGNLDSEVRAYAPGVGGDLWTVQATGDSGAGVGVTIAVSIAGKTVHIHYESGVSTVADVDAAIAALTAGIALDKAGTPATVLTAPGDNFVATNLASGAAGSFVIPETARELRLVTSSAGVLVEVARDAGTLLAPSDFTTSANGYPMVANTPLDVRTGQTQGPPVVSAIRPGGAATVLVYAVSAE